MPRRALAILVLPLLAACGSPPPPPAPSRDGATSGLTWGYDGKRGPDAWGDLSPAFSTCASGASQSPVDLPNPDDKYPPHAAAPPVVVSYASTPLSLLHNGHTVQIAGDGRSTLRIGVLPYTLRQIHVHAPSEHTIHSARDEMELHFVNEGPRGEKAIVAVLARKGAESAALAPYFAGLPKKSGTTAEGPPIDLAALVPKGARFDMYDGSLTTPPCTEGVTWIVLLDPIEVSEAQIDAFHAAVPGPSARPARWPGARPITVGTLAGP